MAANTFGSIFRITSFGESHGTAIGGVIDGCPAGLEIDFEFLQNEMTRRRPSNSEASTKRNEPDEVKFLSGIFEGKTTGTPIGFIIKNKDSKSKDYDHLKKTFRPSHADFTYEQKYGIRDHRGGGRASARETAVRVVAGAIAKMILKEKFGISIIGYVSQIGEVALYTHYPDLDLSKVEESPVRCPDKMISDAMNFTISEVRKIGDTIGGIVTCVIKGTPAGWGEPVYDKLDAELAKAMLSINAARGFDIGAGFLAGQMKGSDHNDEFKKVESEVFTKTNHSGGVQGGISNGQDIFFRVPFKPVATLMKAQESVDSEGNKVTLEGRGRHDVCIVPRAVPVVEAMAALVLVDFYLRDMSTKY